MTEVQIRGFVPWPITEEMFEAAKEALGVMHLNREEVAKAYIAMRASDEYEHEQRYYATSEEHTHISDESASNTATVTKHGDVSDLRFVITGAQIESLQSQVAELKDLHLESMREREELVAWIKAFSRAASNHLAGIGDCHALMDAINDADALLAKINGEV